MLRMVETEFICSTVDRPVMSGSEPISRSRSLAILQWPIVLPPSFLTRSLGTVFWADTLTLVRWEEKLAA